MTISITGTPSVEFWPPRIEPSPGGLFDAIAQNNAWVETGQGPDRFIIGGVNIRTINYGGKNSSGVWDAPWCGPADPDTQVKEGVRPEFPDVYQPVHAWAYDACDPSAWSRDYVRENAERWLELQESNDVEMAFAARMLNDAGAPASSSSFLDALGKLEAAIAETGLPGFIHASPYWAPYAAVSMAVKPAPIGSPQQTNMGTTWVFGGGYRNSLDSVLVATSQPYGWRGAVAVTEAMYDATDPLFIAVAERSFVVGIEKVIAAVDVTI